MALETEGLLRVEVEDLDALVDGAARQQLAFEMQADNTVGMACQCRDALARVPVPDLDSIVQAAADQLGVVKLQGADAPCVPSKRSDFFAGFDIPCSLLVHVRPTKEDGSTYRS